MCFGGEKPEAFIRPWSPELAQQEEHIAFPLSSIIKILETVSCSSRLNTL